MVDGRRFRLAKSVLSISLVAAVSVGGLVYAHHERGFLDFWAEWNYSGYQDTSASSTKPKPYAEYRDLMDQMGRLPAGRAMWEGGQAIDAYGTSLALMLLPYWTHGRIASMEGLYYESSATTPFHFMAVAPLSGPGNASNPSAGSITGRSTTSTSGSGTCSCSGSATTWRTRPKRRPTRMRTPTSSSSPRCATGTRPRRSAGTSTR